MITIEPKISSYAEYLALLEGVGEPIKAVVWVADLKYTKPNSQTLIETVFFLSANSQGFNGVLEKDTASHTRYFPWGHTYQFYVMLDEAHPFFSKTQSERKSER